MFQIRVYSYYDDKTCDEPDDIRGSNKISNKRTREEKTKYVLVMEKNQCRRRISKER